MILCDSGPLIAAAAGNDADHHACMEMFTGLRLAGRRLLVPPTVVAEVGYMLAAWVSTEVEAKFLDAVAAEDFEVVNLTSANFARMAELVRGYDDLPLGTTDASDRRGGAARRSRDRHVGPPALHRRPAPSH